jgi:THO complex subunit 3
MLLMTTGTGAVEVHTWPGPHKLLSVKAHTAGCYAIDVDPTGQMLAVGGADTLVSLWDADDYTCLRTVSRFDKPVRVVRFSKGGELLATGSEDHFIDVADTSTGARVAKVSTGTVTNSLAWSPSEYMLAFVGDAQPSENDRHARNAIRIWGMPVT